MGTRTRTPLLCLFQLVIARLRNTSTEGEIDSRITGSLACKKTQTPGGELAVTLCFRRIPQVYTQLLRP